MNRILPYYWLIVPFFERFDYDEEREARRLRERAATIGRDRLSRENMLQMKRDEERKYNAQRSRTAASRRR